MLNFCDFIQVLYLPQITTLTNKRFLRQHIHINEEKMSKDGSYQPARMHSLVKRYTGNSNVS